MWLITVSEKTRRLKEKSKDKLVTSQSEEKVGGGVDGLYGTGADAEAEKLAELGDEDLNQPQIVQHTDHSVEKY